MNGRVEGRISKLGAFGIILDDLHNRVNQFPYFGPWICLIIILQVVVVLFDDLVSGTSEAENIFSFESAYKLKCLQFIFEASEEVLLAVDVPAKSNILHFAVCIVKGECSLHGLFFD